ncbi:MAG: glycosyltransferase family 4 protein [Candidatus Marinimicrobia bacterium]|nr:glycosyltransferase family 4 protein [Candidatus Neomarinimicrobiota bacterium]
MSPSPATPPPAPRVCVLIGSFHPVVGGGERHAQLLCRELSRQGTTVWVLTRRRWRHLPPTETRDGFLIRRVGPSGFARLGKYLMLPPALWQLWRQRHTYDVIYVCGLRVLGLAGVLAAGWARKRCILRAEARGEWSGAFIWQTPEGRVRPWRRACFRPLIRARNHLLRQADCFLSISSPIGEESPDGGIPPERIASITNGIDTDAFQPLPANQRPARRQQLNLPTDRFILAYAGKLNRGKGLELLLRVFARLAPAQPDLFLLLIGSGAGQPLSCESALRGFVTAHGLESSVRFTGYTEDVAAYLQAADAFVFPSEAEALGLAVLEALACELPVLASDIPGIRDIITNGIHGRLLPPHDEAAWAQAISNLHAQPGPDRRLAATGRANVLEHFSIPAIATAHQNLFMGG